MRLLSVSAGLLFVAAPLSLLVAAPLPAPGASGSASGPAPSSSASSAGEVEVVDVSEQPDLHPQRLAIGALIGPSWYTIKGAGAGTAAFDFALHFDFGLGPGGDPSVWTLGPWVGFAWMPFGDPQPNRFTEIGARLTRRFSPEATQLGPAWVSAGLGLVFTNAPVVTTSAELSQCRKDGAAAAAAGIDCSLGGVLGGLLDLGIGIFEQRARTARWGFGARVPIELSKRPGVGAGLFIYGLVGVAR